MGPSGLKDASCTKPFSLMSSSLIGCVLATSCVFISVLDIRRQPTRRLKIIKADVQLSIRVSVRP